MALEFAWLYWENTEQIEAENYEETIRLEKEASLILNWLKNTNKYEQAKKEYNELIDEIRKSKKNDWIITKNELDEIRKEFDDVENIESYSEKTKRLIKWVWTEIIDIVNKSNNEKDILKDLEEYGSQIQDFFLKKYILEETVRLKSGWKKSEWSTLLQTLAMHKKYNVWSVHNEYQDKLISKILWSDKWYNNEFIKWYNNENSNYLIKINDFESKLKSQNISDINSLALANYFSYLWEKWNLSIDILLNKLWKENIYKLSEIWSNPRDNNSLIAKNKLYWLKIWNQSGMDLIEVIKMFSSSQNFLDKSSGLWKDKNKAELAIKLLKNNINSIRTNFKNDLKERFLKNNPWKEKDADLIIEKMLNELESQKDLMWLANIYKVFDYYNSKYKLWLSINEETKKIIELNKATEQKKLLENQQRLVEAQNDWDTELKKRVEEEIKNWERKIRSYETMSIVHNKTSEEDIKKIISWELSFKRHLENLSVDNKELGVLIKNTLEIEKKEEEKEIDNTKKLDNKSTINKIEASEYSYNTNSWIIEINTASWKQNLELSPIERDLAKNKETLKNIVDFFKTLNELWLSELWKEKEKIFTAISNKYWIGFNSKSDYLSENEIKIFLNSILKSVWKEKIDSTKSISEFKNIFSQKNDRQIIWSWYSDNLLQKWGSKISEQFLQKYILGKPYFDIDWFSKNI